MYVCKTFMYVEDSESENYPEEFDEEHPLKGGGGGSEDEYEDDEDGSYWGFTTAVDRNVEADSGIEDAQFADEDDSDSMNCSPQKNEVVLPTFFSEGEVDLILRMKSAVRAEASADSSASPLVGESISAPSLDTSGHAVVGTATSLPSFGSFTLSSPTSDDRASKQGRNAMKRSGGSYLNMLELKRSNSSSSSCFGGSVGGGGSNSYRRRKSSAMRREKDKMPLDDLLIRGGSSTVADTASYDRIALVIAALEFDF